MIIAASRGSTGPQSRLGWADLRAEPFRIFFPIAVLAALIGVTLWPLLLAGWMEEYPGTRHARLMIQGFFGGFILGILGTSLPRLLETPPLRLSAVLLQAGLHTMVIAFYAFGPTRVGDALFAVELVVWVSFMAGRLAVRRDLPPPGFVLLPLAFVSVLTGLALDWYARWNELPAGAEVLTKLLSYHAFILLCILGAGSFLLPRFLGLGFRQEFPTLRSPNAAWQRAACQAAGTGLLLLGTCGVEAAGWPRLAVTARALIVVAYLWSVLPLERLRWSWRGVHWVLITGLVCIPLGILSSGIWPGWRVGLAHTELVGGFGLITLGVATRVVFGHSGQRDRLEKVQRWLVTAVILMILGLLSRLSGEVLPSTMVRHYIYAAICWGAGLIIWLVCVWRGLLTPDPER